jgi:hypothetical protein
MLSLSRFIGLRCAPVQVGGGRGATRTRRGLSLRYHAKTMDNPALPKRRQNETEAAWMSRRGEFLSDLQAGNDPLVYAQEYLAEFVDWAGVGFFARDRLLDNGQPVPFPARCGERLMTEGRQD